MDFTNITQQSKNLVRTQSVSSQTRQARRSYHVFAAFSAVKGTNPLNRAEILQRNEAFQCAVVPVRSPESTPKLLTVPNCYSLTDIAPRCLFLLMVMKAEVESSQAR